MHACTHLPVQVVLGILKVGEERDGALQSRHLLPLDRLEAIVVKGTAVDSTAYNRYPSHYQKCRKNINTEMGSCVYAYKGGPLLLYPLSVYVYIIMLPVLRPDWEMCVM